MGLYLLLVCTGAMYGQGQYYRPVEGLKQAELKTALFELIQPGYVLDYGGKGEGYTWAGFAVADRMPDGVTVRDRYSDVLRTFDGLNAVSGMNIELRERDALVHYAGGDARRLLNSLELVVNSLPSDDGAIVITNDRVVNVLQQSPAAYDKGGEMHYDIISAFIKSIRGSDPDAAVYWMARMIEGGEDPVFIARRLVISAAEDIGLANPNALLLANAAFDAVTKIGWPEARIPLAEAAVYLASSPKSNSAYLAIGEALAQVKRTGNLPVPLHLRNAPTELMKKMGYAKGYDYPHDFPGHFVRQDYMPDDLRGTCLWTPQANPSENKMKERLEHLWNRKYEE